MQLEPADDPAVLALHELRRLVQGIRAFSYAVEHASGLTGAQLFVLRQLSLEPHASIRRLSERTLTDPSSVSVVVARLVKSGHITRMRDASDHRKSVLHVSKKGALVLERSPEPYQASLITSLRTLSEGDLKVFRTTMLRLSDALGIERSDAPLFFEEPEPSPARKSRAKR